MATLLEPLLQRFGVPEAALHTSAFIAGFIIFSSLHIVVGEIEDETVADRRIGRAAIERLTEAAKAEQPANAVAVLASKYDDT